MQFTWASLGAPRNAHDSTHFQCTSFSDEINASKVLPDKNCVVDGVERPPVILGDCAFPLRSWIVKPHGYAVLTPEKAYFNYRLSRARMIMVGAFDKLKGRFGIWFRKCGTKKGTVNIMGLIILYCIVLYCIAQFMYRQRRHYT